MFRGREQAPAGGAVGRAAVGQSQLVGEHVLSGGVGAEADRHRGRVRGKPVEELGDLGGVVDPEVIGEAGVDLADQVGAGPGGLLGLHAGQRGFEHRNRRPGFCRQPLHLSGRVAADIAAPTVAGIQVGVGDGGEPAGDLRGDLGVDPVEQRLAGLAVMGLGPPRGEGGLALQPVAFDAVDLAAVAGLEPGDQLGGLHRDGAAPRGEHLGRGRAHDRRFAGLAVGAHRHPYPKVGGEAFGEDAFPDRGRGRAHPVDRPGVQGAPVAVGALHAVDDRVVDMQLRVVIPGVVLEERRHRPPVRVHPPPRGAAVVPDPGIAGVVLQVGQGGVVAGPDRVLHRLPVLGPPRLGDGVPGAAGADLGGFERGVQHRHRLLNAERDIQEGHVAPRLAPGLDPEFVAAFSVGVRLPFNHPGVQLVLGGVRPPGVPQRGRRVPAGGVAERLVAGVEEAFEHGLHVLRVDLALEAEGGGVGAPPAARGFAVGDRAGVVVLPPGGDLAQQVVHRVAGGDAQHPDHRHDTAAWP